jgi:hypothetical protein
MPSPKPAVWVEYDPDHNTTGGPRYSYIVALFPSEVAALRSAVKNGNEVTRLPYGTTLADHLAAPPETVEEAVVEVRKPVKGTA